jgi:hypothetical protein
MMLPVCYRCASEQIAGESYGESSEVTLVTP